MKNKCFFNLKYIQGGKKHLHYLKHWKITEWITIIIILCYFIYLFIYLFLWVSCCPLRHRTHRQRPFLLTNEINTVSTPDASGKISYSRTHYNKWCCLHNGYDKSPTLNWCLVLFMTYWHKVKMICNSRFVAPGEWSREQECICPVIFSAFSFWMNSSCLGLCDFVYGFSLPFHKPIHLPF